MYTHIMSDEVYAKRYRTEFIEPGIISYEDQEAGTVLVRSRALDLMLKSFIGKPVVNEDHIDLTPDEAFKKSDADQTALADGVVTDVGKGENGWYWADLLIWNEATIKNIDENGYRTSCAYVPDKVGPEGQYHGIPFDEEILGGAYTHMAVVKDPRYEAVTIYENSKTPASAGKRSKLMPKKFKLFGTKKNMAPPPPPPEEKPEEGMEMEGAYIEVDGERIPVEEAVNAYKQNKENEVQPMAPEDTIDIDGEMVSGADLAAAYKAAKGAQNAEPPQDVKGEPVVDESLQNKKAEPENGEQKKNAHFKAVKNAATKSPVEKIKPNTRSNRLKAGKERYGTLREVKA